MTKIRMHKKGKNHHLYGKHHTEETKRKISKANKGKKKSEEWRQKISKANKGRKCTEETKLKMSIAKKGKKLKHDGQFKMGNIPWNTGISRREETKRKISKANKGKKLSEETKRKIGEFHKGKITSEETKKKMSDTRKKRKKENGYLNSPETRKKMSKSLKGLFKGEKNPSWMGGISFEPYGIEFNNELKVMIRKRDGYKCKECDFSEKQLGRNLDIHHIDFNKKNNKPNNLISLCRSCHMQTNFNRKDWTKYYQEKMNIINGGD